MSNSRDFPCLRDNVWKDDAGTHLRRYGILSCVYGDSLPEGEYPEIFGELERLAQNTARRAGFAEITLGSLNNNRGSWFEMMAAASLWNASLALRRSTDLVTVHLPSATQGGVRLPSFLTNDVRNQIRGAEIFSSNTDFLCARDLEWDRLPEVFNRQITSLSERNIQTLLHAHERLLARCGRGSIASMVALKTSTRPDRRYQIMHEANLLKAIAIQLNRVNQDQEENPSFIVITTEPHDADERILRAPSFASVTIGQPSPTVDQIFNVRTTAEMDDTATNIISELVE